MTEVQQAKFTTGIAAFDMDATPSALIDLAGAYLEVGVSEDELVEAVADGWCPRCFASGDERHPLWGSRNCPDPTITCRRCGGAGNLTGLTADDIREGARG